MCRWLVWCSHDSISLSDVILHASNSLMVQSFDAGYHPGLGSKNNMRLNADGFGVGWYNRHGRAASYRSIKPAWNNRNLRELCSSVESHCIMAHIRAATPSSVVSEENCHPFRYGSLLFQHNGHVEGFERIKRLVMNELPDELYNFVEGTTDSEVCFALLLSLLEPASLARARESGKVSAAEIQSATLGTIAILRDFLESEQIESGYSTFNFAVTDGQSVVVTRYCDKAPRIPPPSLYYAFLPSDDLRSHLCPDSAPPPLRGPAYGLSVGKAGNREEEVRAANVSRKGNAALRERCERGAFICASEPLTRSHEQWHLVEENSMICYSVDHGILAPGAGMTGGASTAAAAPCAAEAEVSGRGDAGAGVASGCAGAVSMSSSMDQLPRAPNGSNGVSTDLLQQFPPVPLQHCPSGELEAIPVEEAWVQRGRSMSGSLYGSRRPSLAPSNSNSRQASPQASPKMSPRAGPANGAAGLAPPQCWEVRCSSPKDRDSSLLRPTSIRPRALSAPAEPPSAHSAPDGTAPPSPSSSSSSPKNPREPGGLSVTVEAGDNCHAASTTTPVPVRPPPPRDSERDSERDGGTADGEFAEDDKPVSVTPLRLETLRRFVKRGAEVGAPRWRRRFVLNAVAGEKFPGGSAGHHGNGALCAGSGQLQPSDTSTPGST